MQVRVTFSGRNYDIAGALPEQLTLPEGCSLSQALKALSDLLPPEKRLAESCLICVSGTHQGTVRSHRQCALKDGDELLLIAPVAGG